MGHRAIAACLRPLVETSYAILDEDLADRGEVTICSADRLIPRLGDRFTIESAGMVHDVGVFSLTTSQAGWRVTCRADEPRPK